MWRYFVIKKNVHVHKDRITIHIFFIYPPRYFVRANAGAVPTKMYTRVIKNAVYREREKKQLVAKDGPRTWNL